MTRPIIGISMDYALEGSFSSRPHVALREHYFNAVWARGGMPVLLPPIKEALPEQMALCGGVLIPGGEFATPVHWYEGEGDKSPYGALDHRLHYDMALVEALLAADKPVLAICAGMQLMAGMLGGRLTPNVGDYYKSSIDHMHGAKAEHPAHRISIAPESLLRHLVGHDYAEVNSAHREGVVSVPANATPCATSDDGVIEAFELPQQRFALAVEWHPEFLCATHDADGRIISGFVAASAL